MASEIRVDKINSLSGVGTVTLSPTGVDISGITTVQTLKVGTGLTASEDGDIFFTGVCTATTFAGAHSGSGANLTSLPAAQLSGTLPALSAANLTSIPAANVTGTLPAISGANLTNLPAANVTGTLPAISGANLTSLTAANLSGALPAISAANLTSIPAANITGTLPAISGANLTGISAGITQADQWRINSQKSNSYGTAQVTANWERNDTSFQLIGSGMTESSGTFSFPATGIYLIRAIASYAGSGDDRQHLGLLIRATTNNSSYSEIAQVFDSSGNNGGNANRYDSNACVVAEAIFDVTDVSTHKVQMWHNTVGDAHLLAESYAQCTGMTFLKLGDT